MLEFSLKIGCLNLQLQYFSLVLGIDNYQVACLVIPCIPQLIPYTPPSVQHDFDPILTQSEQVNVLTAQIINQR